MHAAVRVAGLRRTLRMTARLGADAGSDRGRPAAPALSRQELVAETARKVAAAAAFYPQRALCLEQSLALQLLLHRRGVEAALRLGVQPRPFNAHAWVEVDGEPVAEQQDLPRTLMVFPALEV